MNLKSQLKSHLSLNKMTASELARRSKVPKQTISDWLGGVPPRSIPYLKAIADVFKTTVDDLLFGNSDNATRARSLASQKRAALRIDDSPMVAGFIDSLPDIVSYWNSDLRNLYANQAITHFLDKTPEEILGKTAGELLGPELYSKHFPRMQRALNGEAQTFEHDLPTNDGGTIPTVIKYIPNIFHGKVLGFAVVVTDISGVIREIHERNSTDANSQQSKVLNSIPDMIGYWDANLINKYANHAYMIFFGKDPHEIIGQTMADVIGPELFELNQPFIQGVLRGQAQTFIRDIPTPSGITRRTVAKYIPDFIDGKVCGFAVVVSDISEIK